jgi:predicted site-specific integrase-resolvase
LAAIAKINISSSYTYRAGAEIQSRVPEYRHSKVPDDPVDVRLRRRTMNANLLIPAAQYLRMSTEHQQYSLENQTAAIQKYSESHGFQVVRTYSDAAKRGLVLRHRKGLQQLLQDVVSGTHNYRVILVYDVSRWGRFQDTDESAHYEFLCKSVGVPVHYCAETFANDGIRADIVMESITLIDGVLSTKDCLRQLPSFDARAGQ